MSALPAPVSLDSTYGCFLIGTHLCMALWGIGTLQTYIYFGRFPNDRWEFKALVAFAWILDTVHQALITASIYNYLIHGYGDLLHLLQVGSALKMVVIVTGVMIITSQSFFLYRVWRLSGGLIITSILTFLCLGQFAAYTTCYAKVLSLSSFDQITTVHTILKVASSLGAVTEFSIAMTIIYYLQHSRTTFEHTQWLIHRLIRFTINTGLATGVCAILSLVFIFTLPKTFVYIVFYLLISKLYVNSLLAGLNSRQSLRGRGTSNNEPEGGANTFGLNHMNGANSIVHTLSVASRHQPISIKVDTETTRDDSLKHLPSETDVDSTNYTKDQEM